MSLFVLAWIGCATQTTDSADTGSDSAADTADSADTASDEPGVLGLMFSLDVDLIPDMEEPPIGNFRGSIYAEDQASALGPIDGAVALADIEIALDFFTTSDTTGVLWTSDPWPAQKLWVLGCLDSDGNDCDKKDPITVPNTNKFLLAPGGETDVTVSMELLNPS